MQKQEAAAPSPQMSMQLNTAQIQQGALDMQTMGARKVHALIGDPNREGQRIRALLTATRYAQDKKMPLDMLQAVIVWRGPTERFQVEVLGQ